MDQLSFDFIKAAMIERVKAEPIYTYWKERVYAPYGQGLLDPDAGSVKYGLLVAINLGSGFELYNLSEQDVKNTFEGITVGFSPFSNSPIVSNETLIELHKILREREA
jgi:hypothetical protein